jgi:hypothetical protein
MPRTTASWPYGARPRVWPPRARGLAETRTAQALFERDSAIAHAGRRLAALDIAKDRVLVGRLDFADGSLSVRGSPGRPGPSAMIFAVVSGQHI